MNNIGGSPKGLPYPNQGDFLEDRRGGAEGELPRRGKRGHPGVCPSRRIPGISPYLAGRSGTGPYEKLYTLWGRPLRPPAVRGPFPM